MSVAQRQPDSAVASPYFTSDDGRFVLYQGDCLELMPQFPPESFELIFADPPYFLSNDGITCHAGKMVSVNKGKWDRSMGFAGNYDFTRRWLGACRRLLKPNGTVWVSGTSHIIHIVGAVLDELGFKGLNDITWVKPNPPPNLSCRYFTHATETVIWAGRDKSCRHKFNYALMKRLNGGKQMTSVWTIDAPRRDEKLFGKHPTQKPLALLERIIAAATDEDECVLDPFSGSATTGIAATRMNRRYLGIELERLYNELGVVRLEGVPQADCPERILDVILCHRKADPGVAGLAHAMGLTERQAIYYRQAASYLGFLCPLDGGWALTPMGLAFSATNLPTARTMLASRMRELPIVQIAQRLRRASGAAGAQTQRIAEMLRRCTGLAGATCERRARTIRIWSEWAEANIPSEAQITI